MTTNNTTNTTANNRTAAAELQRRVNDAAVEGVQRLLDASGKIAADGHLKMAVVIKLTAKVNEDNMVVRADDRTSSTHTVADVTLDVRADIDGAMSATADGDLHGERY